jgi:hypothetical protein
MELHNETPLYYLSLLIQKITKLLKLCMENNLTAEHHVNRNNPDRESQISYVFSYVQFRF